MRRGAPTSRWRVRAALAGVAAVGCVALTSIGTRPDASHATPPAAGADRPDAGAITATTATTVTTTSSTSTTTSSTTTTSSITSTVPVYGAPDMPVPGGMTGPGPTVPAGGRPDAATTVPGGGSSSGPTTVVIAVAAVDVLAPVDQPPTRSTTSTPRAAGEDGASGASTSSVPGAQGTPSTTTLVPLTDDRPAFDMLRLTHLDAAFDTLLGGNLAVAVTVVRDGLPVYRHAVGATLGGGQVTTATPMVLASVSKLITAETVAKLVEAHRLELDTAVPWSAMGIAHDPAWDTVTVRELLTHTSGMPIARESWLNDPGSCAIPLQAALASPPRGWRGTWVYSNGNYCALGLLVEHVTGLARDAAARQLVLDPLHLTDAHLTTDGPVAGDGPYAQGIRRLERLGGAGTWMASTDTVAMMVAQMTPEDHDTLVYPGIFTDQYGWGHTGTVDGAKACAWQLEGGRTTIVAIVAGNRPDSGGGLCDVVVPALAGDLGLGAAKPVRLPD